MVSIGQQVPDFTLPDLREHAFRLSTSLVDGPVVLAFFRTTCPTSRIAFPYWQELRAAYPQPGWSIVGISQDSAVETAGWVAQRHGTFPILIDAPDLAVSWLFDPPVSPTLYLVQPDWTLAFVGEGFAKADLNDVAARIADRVGTVAVTVAPPDDGTPLFRPG